MPPRGGAVRRWNSTSTLGGSEAKCQVSPVLLHPPLRTTRRWRLPERPGSRCSTLAAERESEPVHNYFLLTRVLPQNPSQRWPFVGFPQRRF